MSIEDAHQAGTDKVLDHMAANQAPQRIVEHGMEFDETARLAINFASDHYGAIIWVAAIIIAAIGLRRFVKWTTLASRNKALWLAGIIGAVVVSCALFGPTGGAWVGGVVFVTAFNRWRYPPE